MIQQRKIIPAILVCAILVFLGVALFKVIKHPDSTPHNWSKEQLVKLIDERIELKRAEKP